MMSIHDMLQQAGECEERADKARDPTTALALLEAAQHWRTIAVHMSMLERERAYRMVRVRTE
jgi:hypothetical protein